MKIIDLEQGTEEWLAFRRNKIGASDAPIIMGVSPWQTPFQLWQDKCMKHESQVKNSAMSRGVQLEPVARAKYNEYRSDLVHVFNEKWDFQPAVVLSEEYDWMMASLDGMTTSPTSLLVEIKCPGKVDHQEALEGRIPKKYYPQLQHILAVCDSSLIDYFSFDGENGVIVPCYADYDYIEELIEKEMAFMKCMKTLTPPELAKRDYNKFKAEAEIQNALISIFNVWKAA